MSHFIRKCECGAVLAQCKCMDPNKKVEYIRPCLHYFSTHSVASEEKVNIETLYDLYLKFINEAPVTPNIMKVHPSVYNDLMEYFAKQEAEEAEMGIKRTGEWLTKGLIFGTKVIIDRSLKPGEWKFEYVHEVAREQ